VLADTASGRRSACTVHVPGVVARRCRNGGHRMTFLTRQHEQKQLDGLELLEFEETVYDRTTVSETSKHWYVYLSIA